jgi:serine/threonine protein kinase
MSTRNSAPLDAREPNPPDESGPAARAATSSNDSSGAASGPRSLPQSGDVIAGKYQLEKTLGRGAMGLVMVATHITLCERVALKFLLLDTSPELAADLHARFLREARVSAKLRNEHVVRVTDVAVLDSGIPFMAMELLEGHDLGHVIQQHRGGLPIDVAVEYVVQVCEGLAEAHAMGVVHRDLKPTNLFLTKRADGTPLVKILDFGISKWSHSSSDSTAKTQALTEAGVVLGTPKYMSPEQLLAAADVDARGDVWAIGAILFELLTGQAPFQGNFSAVVAQIMSAPIPKVRAKRPEVPEALEAAIARAMQRDIDRRTPSVADLAADILNAVVPKSAATMRSEFIRAALEKRSPRLDASSSGEHGAVMVSSGSFKRRELALDLESTMQSSDTARMRAQRKGRLVGLALAAGVGLVSTGFFVLAHSSKSSVPAASAAQEASPAPRAPAAVAPPPVAAPLASAVAPAPIVASAAPVEAAKPPAPTPHPTRGGGRVVRDAKPRATAEAPTKATPTEPTAAPRAPNLYEDRQ